MDYQMQIFSTPKPKDFFGLPKKPIGGSSFRLKSNPFSNSTDFEIGRGGYVTETGQVVDNSSGAQMSGYKLKLSDLARRHQPKRKASELANLGESDIGKGSAGSIFNSNSKKRRVKDTLFPSLKFADGVTTASTSIGNFGFNLENLRDEREMTATSGFHSNGSIPGERLTVIPADDCMAPGEGDIVITTKRPFLHGFEDETLKNLQGVHSSSSSSGSTFNVLNPKGFQRDGIWPFANEMAGFPSVPRRGFTLASFNYWVAQFQIYHNTAQNIRGDEERQVEMLSHFKFLDEFAIHGIVDSEMYASGQSSFGRNLNEGSGIKSVTSMTDKGLNIIYEGKAQQKNIWGPVIAGTTLWLIWKKVKRPDEYITSSNGTGSSVITSVLPTVSVTNSNASTMPFQLVPYACPEHTEPPMSELMFESDHIHSPNAFKRKHVGVCFYIGQMLKPQDTSIGHGDADKIARRQMQTKAVYDCTAGQSDLVEILVMTRVGSQGRISRPESFPFVNSKFMRRVISKEINEMDIKKG